MKVLIPVYENKLKPIGGPYGYLYNLKKGLDQIDDQSICFFPVQQRGNESKKSNKLLLKFWKYYKVLQIILPAKKRTIPLDFSEYEVVHFHSTLDLYMYRKNIEDYNGIILLSSHSPMVWHKEFSSQFVFGKKVIEIIVEKVDIYAFDRCDYLVFPCKEAEEPYYHTWDKYEDYSKNKKFKYIPTGIAPCESRISKKDIRQKYDIPQDAKVICYVGRHNVVKGYDIIKDAFKFGLESAGIYVLVAGKEEPMEGIKNSKQWIECGWTNDPYSIINAADVFVLPNRETYFDLIALEVLSLGKKIIMSDTGGNRFFMKYKEEGITFFRNDDYRDLYEKIIFVLGESVKNNNYELYMKHFTQEVFANNYKELVMKIVDK